MERDIRPASNIGRLSARELDREITVLSRSKKAASTAISLPRVQGDGRVATMASHAHLPDDRRTGERHLGAVAGPGADRGGTGVRRHVPFGPLLLAPGPGHRG